MFAKPIGTEFWAGMSVPMGEHGLLVNAAKQPLSLIM
jgi:hypothetical protein